MKKIIWQGTPAVGYEPKQEKTMTKKQPVVRKSKTSLSLKSFEELKLHLTPKFRGSKPDPTAMLVSVTLYVDKYVAKSDGTVRLLKVQPNERVKSARVPRTLMKKYVKGNSDGTITVTGRNAIERVTSRII